MSNKSFGKYITLKEASRLCPYSAQYLGLRARQGKLKAIKIGRDWMTTKEWLEEYINQVQEWKETQRGYKTNNVSSHTQNQSLLPQKYHSSLPSLMAKSLLSIILFLLFFYSFCFAFEQQGLFPIKENLVSPSTIFKPLHKEKLYASLSLTSPSTYSIFSDLTQSFSSLARQIVYPKPLSLSSLIGNKPSYTPSHNVSFSDKYLVLEKQLRSLLIQQQIKDQEIEELKQEIANLNKEGIPTKEIIKEVQQITQIQPKEIIEKQIKVLASKDLQEIKQELETIKEWKKDIDNLRLITQKLQSRPSYTTASTAPLYVGTQGIQVGGHGNFDSLGVSGSASIGQSLGVSGSVTLGSPNSSTDQLTVNSTSQFREPATFEKGATFGTSTLTIDENGNLETTGTITAQNIQIQDTGTTIFGGVTYTWPTSGGTNGQVLTTDGSGNLSWQTISSGNLNASYLTLSLDDNLTNERVLTQGEGISFEDTGANGTLTISLDATTDIIPEGTTNLYYTDSRARQVLSASAPITYDSSTGVIGLTTPLSTTYGGTGIDTSSSTGVPSISSGTWSVNSVLPLSLGGTNANLTATSGGIVYSTDSALAISSAGTSGQILTSQGTSAPSWSNIASLLTAGTNISISGTTNATIATVDNPVFSTSVTTPLLLTSSGAITIETGASAGEDDILFKPAEEEKLRIKENGDLFFEKGTYDTTLTITTPTANRTITFPDASGTVAVSATAPITLSSEGTIGLTTPLSTTYGGTGLSSIGTANQILGVNSDATALEYKTLQGTTNQINVTHSTGAITLSTPQDIAQTSSPTFSGLTLSSLTEGSILFTGSSGIISEDNSNLYFDNTNKRLGIGTNTPSETLEVKGNILLPKTGTADDTTQYPSYLLKLTGSSWDSANSQAVDKTFSLKAIGLTDDSRLGIFNNSGTEILTIKENGNVGIGTTSPGNLLSLYKSSADARHAGIRLENPYGGGVIGYSIVTSGVGDTSGLPDDAFAIHDNYHGYRLVINESGNVGIGTTKPQQKLTLGPSSNLAIELSSPSGLSATTSASGTLNGTYYYKVSASDGVGWTTLSSEEVSATVDGGTTAGTITVSWSAVTGATKYRVWRGTSSGNQTEYYETTSTSIDDDGSLTYTSATPPSSTTAYVVKVTSSGNSWFLGGNVGIGTGSPGAKLTIATASDGAEILRFATDRPWSFWQRSTGGSTSLDLRSSVADKWFTITNPDGEEIARFYAGTATDANNYVSFVEDRVRITDSGNVGIGTTSPGSPLDIQRAGSAGFRIVDTNAGKPEFRFVASDGGVIYLQGVTAHPMLFLTDNTERMRIDANGNVGIGTESPQLKLHVNGKSAVGDSITSTRLNSGNGPRAFSLIDTNAVLRVWRFDVEADSAIELIAGTNDDATNAANQWWDIAVMYDEHQLRFRDRTGGTIRERLVIDESGNVGIGTTSPSEKLEVVGQVKALKGQKLGWRQFKKWYGYDGSEVHVYWNRLYQITGNEGYVTFQVYARHDINYPGFALYDVSVHKFNGGSSYSISVIPSAVNRHIKNKPRIYVALDSNGYIWVKAHVIWNSEAAFRTIAIEGATELSTISYQEADPSTFIVTDGESKRADSNLSVTQSALMYPYIDSNGNVGIGTTNPGSYKLYVNGSAYSTGGWHSSDVRLKKNIEPLSNVLEKIQNINGVKFDWRVDEFPEKSLPKGRQIGIIAQEVEKEFPELVSEDNEGYKALAYDRFTAVLLEAIKEQQKEIEEIQSQLQLSVKEDSSGKIVPQQPQTDIRGQLLSLGLVVNENGVLEVRKLKTEELCVGNVCVNEEQLKELLEKAGISTTQNSNLKTQNHNSKVKSEEPNENQDLDNSSDASENSNPEDTTDTIDTIDTIEESCIPNWQCSDWQPLPNTICLGETFVQTRECVDLNECGVETEKPEEEREMTGEKDCSETTSTTTPETVAPATTTPATTIPTTTTSATTTPTTTSEN